MTVAVRKATGQDIEAFSSRPSNHTLRAFVGDLDGEIIALGGLATVKGRHYAFLDLTEKARPYKMHIMRAAIRVFKEARQSGIRFVYAEADANEPKSSTWLERLGFEPDPRADHLYILRL